MAIDPGLLFCVFSLLCGVVLGVFDWRAEKIVPRKKEGISGLAIMKGVLKYPLRFWVTVVIWVTYYVAVFPFLSLAV